MSNAKYDEEVIRTVQALEFAVKSGPLSKETDSAEDILVNAFACSLIDFGSMDEMKKYRIERIREAWRDVVKALEVRQAAYSNPGGEGEVVELSVVESRKEGNGEHLALMSGGKWCDIENTEVFEPLKLKRGDTIQVRVK